MEKPFGKWKADGKMTSEFSKQGQTKLKCLLAELTGRSQTIWGTDPSKSTKSSSIQSGGRMEKEAQRWH